MCNDTTDDKERIAREQGWESFEDAPDRVQRHIECRHIEIENPHGILRPGEGE